MDTGHGFVWPAGLPGCGLCGSPAQDPIHVTPARTTFTQTAAVSLGSLPRTAHNYVMPSGRTPDVLCLACSNPLSDTRHPTGMSSGRLKAAEVVTTAVASRESAFVAEIGGRIVIAGRGFTGADMLPAGIADVFREKSASESANLWVTGRYVEADSPNRNAAYWSTADLELGQPTVAHGPINWLHEERHIIGAIAASELVHPDREAAAEGVGNHIVALGALWPWVYHEEARMVRDASNSESLWFSMECVSRAVACLDESCGSEMTYRDYMTAKDTRCEHMQAGQPRRFVDPIFEGAGIIVPPVRPGWAKADARVLMPQAAALAERQAAAFDGMATTDAEMVVAQLIASAEEPVDA